MDTIDDEYIGSARKLAWAKNLAVLVESIGGVLAYYGLSMERKSALRGQSMIGSSAQGERQQTRSRGQYSPMQCRCELCNKGLAQDNYFSDARLDDHPDWHGVGVCLCGKCFNRLAKLSSEEALALLGMRSE